MSRVFRLDYGRAGDPTRTPQGGLAIPADLTRTGVFSYQTSDGKTIREYRPPSEVFRKETLDSLKGATLALDHPPGRIDPYNYRQFTQGHVGDDVRRDGDKTAATIYVQDQQSLKAIDAGRRELSCGYHVDVDEKPGVVPAGEPDAGMAYDRVQKNILYNHVALVDHGRAGDEVRLRLDSEGNSILGEQPMPELAAPVTVTQKFERIDGVEYIIDSDPHRAARTRFDAAQKEVAKGIVLLKKQRDDALAASIKDKARADKADEKMKKLVAEVKEALKPERMDARVANRAGIVTKAAAVMGKDWKADGKPNAKIKAEVIAKVHPDLRLDSADSRYLQGLWDAIVLEAKPGQRQDAAGRPVLPEHLRTPPASAEGDKKKGTVARIRADAQGEEDERYRRPLAFGKKGRAQGPSHQAAQIESMK